MATDGVAARAELADRTGLGVRAVGRILNLLDETGLDADTSAVDQVIARAEAYRSIQKSRIEMMRAYAETQRCRRQFLLQYFGETDAYIWGLRQLPRRHGRRRSGTASPFAVEQRVQHDTFGLGPL